MNIWVDFQVITFVDDSGPSAVHYKLKLKAILNSRSRIGVTKGFD